MLIHTAILIKKTEEVTVSCQETRHLFILPILYILSLNYNTDKHELCSHLPQVYLFAMTSQHVFLWSVKPDFCQKLLQLL